jgi:hypothetical protein
MNVAMNKDHRRTSADRGENAEDARLHKTPTNLKRRIVFCTRVSFTNIMHLSFYSVCIDTIASSNLRSCIK